MRRCLLALTLLATTGAAHAVELRISAGALERTLTKQLFNAPDGRYYIRGHDGSACYVYAAEPHVSFAADRVVIHIKTRARLGGGVFGACVGLNMAPEVDVSFLPSAEGETIGFKDARLENLTESKELNLFLLPFLSRKLPQQMSVNAADLLGKMLAASQPATGYEMHIEDLRLRSMQVIGHALVVDVDGALSVK